MTILPIVAFSAVLLVVAYFTYGRWVMRWLGTDPGRTTPAVARSDGNDFVPAAAPVVLGGHLTAIAAAGPVVGPIVAGLAFGWAPALAWILLGAIFIGAVHDSGALLASIRHHAASITQVVRAHLSRSAFLSFLVFVWISLLYVIVAFTDVVAGTFTRLQEFSFPGAGAGPGQSFSISGESVVIGATAYLVVSVLLGVANRWTRLPMYLTFPAALAAVVTALALAPTLAPYLAWLNLGDAADVNTRWELILLAYCFIASVVPMWLLLQPRGVIGATFLYAALAFGIVGTLIGGWTTAGGLEIRYPAFTSFETDLGLLFPILFITVACGACSGFHSIVASGTTCRQLRNERDVRPVAYGGMLLEAMVAVLALSCVMVLTQAQARGLSPDALYAKGIGNFMALCGIPLAFGVAFGLLAFSSFVFDTLDVCTRLGRYVLQELTGLRGGLGIAVATAGTLLPPMLYLTASPPGAFRTFWALFGTSNQLLAALTLIGVSVYLWRTGRPVWFALVPAAFMLATTGAALSLNLNSFARRFLANGAGVDLANAAIALLLLGLATLVTVQAARLLLRGRPVPA